MKKTSLIWSIIMGLFFTLLIYTTNNVIGYENISSLLFSIFILGLGVYIFNKILKKLYKDKSSMLMANILFCTVLIIGIILSYTDLI